MKIFEKVVLTNQEIEKIDLVMFLGELTVCCAGCQKQTVNTKIFKKVVREHENL